MKTLFITGLLLIALGDTVNKSETLIKDTVEIEITDVYICTGKYSKRYHYNKNCRGLSNCKGEIKRVYLNEAKHKGRTLCGWED